MPSLQLMASTADDAAIMDQTGHKSLAMVHRYHRRPKKWVKPASAKLGL
jgi:integrase